MLPSSLLHFTSRHKQDDGTSYTTYIDTVEDLIRAFSMLLPGQFEDSDLCSQGILAGLNLLSLYHTKHLVQKSIRLKGISTTSDDTPTIVFNERFLKFNSSSGWCKAASWTLSIISYTEVLFEMLLNRRVGNATKWKWITSMEGFKAILRLVIFYGTKRRMVLHPTHFIRNVDPSSLEVIHEEKYELSTLDPRTGTALSSTHHDPSGQVIMGKSKINGWMQLSELLWVIRPFVYTLMIYLQRRKQSRESKVIRSNVSMNEKRHDMEAEAEVEADESFEKEDEGSWKPWLVSLGIDLLARIARHMQPMSGLEKDESSRRDYLLLYYLLRGPIYLKFTRVLLDKLCNATEHRPLVSVVTAALNDYRPFWEDSYFYTAGS